MRGWHSSGFAALAGSCASHWLAIRPLWALLLAAVALAAMGALLVAKQRRWRKSFAGLIAGLVAGLLWSSLVADRHAELRWTEARNGERILAQVEVASIPVWSQGGVQFDGLLQLESRPARVRVRWPDLPAAASDWPRAGESWQLVLRLSAPTAARNPGWLDVDKALFRERTAAFAGVVPSRLNRRDTAAPLSLNRVRAAIVERMGSHVIDRDAAALAAALAVGFTGNLSTEQWRVFSATGTTHLIAISGMHVTLFAWLAAGLTRRLWTVLPGAVWVEREHAAAAVSLAAAFAYALLAGFEIPAQRTCLMLAVWWAARLSERSASGVSVISLALLGVLLLDPFAPLDPGFWLSFIAIAVLIGADGLRAASTADAPAASWWDRVRSLWSQQWVVGIALAPVTFALFGNASVIGLIANLLAIPLFSLLLVPIVLFATAALAVWPLAAAICLRAVEWIYFAVWPWLEAAANLPLAIWSAQPGVLWLVCAAILLPAIVLPLPRWIRAAPVLLLVPLWWGGSTAPPEGSWQAVVFAAGDATALVVRTRRHVIVYDTGDSYGSNGRFAQATLGTWLAREFRGQVDLLVISRANMFRVTGAAQLSQRVRVARLRFGGDWSGRPRAALPCPRTANWRWDGVEFALLSAGPGRSCVLRVQSPGGSLLVGAQLDRAEAEALSLQPMLRPVNVLIAPRSGAPELIPAAFIAATRPSKLIVSARTVSSRRDAQLRALWGLEASALHTTGNGALQITARAPDGVRIASQADGERPPIWRAAVRGP